MKVRNLLVCLGAAVLLSACIPSVNPFYTSKDVIQDSRLLGTWADPDNGSNTWSFETKGTNAYTLKVTEGDGKAGTFTAVLFNLKGHTFLDTIPDKVDLKDDQAGMVGMSLIRGHLIIRVRELSPQLKIDFCDWDWLKDYIQQHPQALAHRGGGGDDDPIVLTAGTRDLQKFVLQHLKPGELFKVEKPDAGLIRTAKPATQ